MLDRDKEILQDKWATDNYCDLSRKYIDTSFKDGLDWSDEHPSKKTIYKIITLYSTWAQSNTKVGIIEYIKNNWND